MSDPQTLLHFDILERVGEGGMGTVYKARDTRNGAVVALKLLTYQGRLEESAVRRFRREFRAAAHLVHPHVARVYEIFQNGHLFFTMEFVDGVPITKYFGLGGPTRPDPDVLNDPVRIRRIVEVFGQLLDVLGFIHDNQIVHRDIKPDNIFITPGPPSASTGDAPACPETGSDREGARVKVLDFGLARQINLSSKITRSGVIVGTAEYMSPEQALGADLDSRSDIYSVGVLLYQILTGSVPFAGEEIVPILLKHAYEAPPPPRRLNPGLNPVLEDVVLKLLAKDPADRFQAAVDCHDALKLVTAHGGPGLAARAGGRPDAPVVPAALNLFAPRFVGRETEMVAIRGVLNNLIDGHGDVVAVSGESGVGKTRLIQEVKRYCAVKKIACFFGSCFEDQSLPYSPFIPVMDEISRDLLGMDAEDVVPLLGPGLTFIADLFPRFQRLPGVQALPPSATIHPEGNRVRFHDAAAALLRALGRVSPVLLCLDDMQWADENTLELMQYLVRNVVHPDRELGDAGSVGRLVILLAHREEGLTSDARFGQALQRLTDAGLLRRFPVGPLPPEQIRRFVISMLGQEEDIDEFAAWVGRETGGNPFFIEEYVKALAEEGTLRRDGPAWTLHPGGKPLPAFFAGADLDAVRLPSTIRALLTRRLAGLPPAAIKALGAAAAIGAEFEFPLLLKVSGLPEDDLLDAVDQLIKRRLVREVESDRFAFTQLQIRSAVLDDMIDRRRRRLHAKVGEALEQFSGGAPDPIAAAYHFVRAGETDRALAYLPEAGRRLKNAFSNVEAQECFEQVLRICRDDEHRSAPESQRLEMEARRHLADILRHVGRCDEAFPHYERVREIARQAGDRRNEATAVIRVGDLLLRKGRYDEAEGHAAAGREIALEVNDPLLLAEAFTVEGNLHWHRGLSEESLNDFKRALELRAKAGDRAGEAAGLNNIGYVHVQRGEFSTAMSYFESSLAIRRELRDVYGVALSLEAMGIILEQRGEYARALTNHEEVLSIMRKIGSRRGIGYSLLSIGNVHAYRGEYPEALGRYREALCIKEELGDRRGKAMVLINTGMVLTLRADAAGAATALAEAASIAAGIGQPPLVAFSAMARAELDAWQGRPEDAAEAYEKALGGFRGLGDRFGEAQALSRMAGCMLALGRKEDAAAAAESALAYARSIEAREIEVRALIVLSQLEPSLEKAMTAARTAALIGAKDLFIRALAAAAAVCGMSGNRLHARELASRARDAAEELALGMDEASRGLFLSRPDIRALADFE